ncbi:MAG: Ni/Fe hydrogenase subunit alpha [Thermoprotei archaeon]|nr:MAG: Ni/Fe hydrogenase subunit alpha [Thermoprotei archaeon]
MAYQFVSIDPVTRVEGEVRAVIVIDDKGEVKDAYYQTLEIRGFEAFCKGRAVEELPRITSAVCGVCSWAHHVASGKTLDVLFGREPPPTAKKLREIAYFMQIIDSHLLHFIVMALPDFALPNAPPELRNIAGLLREDPKVATLFLKSRSIIKDIEEVFGGKPIHTAFVLPGGISRRFTKEDIEKIDKLTKELYNIVDYIVDYFNKKILKSEIFQKYLYDDAYMLRTYYMGIVGESDTLNFYDGELKIIDSSGREVARFDAMEYTKYIAEHMTNWAYSKFPYLKWLGWKGFNEEYLVRVGPLARLNVIDRIPSERAQEEYEHMVDVFGDKPIHNTMAYHWARIIETLHSIERMRDMIQETDLLSNDILNLEGEPRYEGVGVIEAPRGVLIHHYKANEELLATHVNIITPTTLNNAAINTELKKVAKKILSKKVINDDTLNKLEMSIRAYDPCNSCATHYMDLNGRKLFTVLIVDSNGHILNKIGYKSQEVVIGCPK